METHPRRFERYVALGDSSTEGLNDPDGTGGYVGWSRRLAARIADIQGGLLYANLGARGRTTRQILEQQLEPALSLRPDLVTIFSGTNDVIGRRFDPHSVLQDMEHMQRTCIKSGATVLTFTLPDLTPIMPIARWIAPRIQAMNDAVRKASAGSGVTLLDFAAVPVATDPRLWHEDRIHANAAGHRRIADALAFALRLPGTDEVWGVDLPPMASPSLGSKWVAEITWMHRYFFPWILWGVRAGFRRKERERGAPKLASIAPRA